MAVSIDQKPLYTTLPIGQQIIFSVSEPTIVATRYKVKFIAEIHVSNNPITLSNNSALIGTFKTTPNNAGVGIFDFRSVIETFVKPDNEPSFYSTYKGIPKSISTFPLHLIDKFSLSDNSIKYFAIQFKIEFAVTADGAVLAPGDTDLATGISNTQNADNSDQYTMFNGVLQYDDVLTKSLFGNNYGYNLDEFYLDDSNAKFLTNAPTTQYARLEDYGTFPFLNYHPTLSDDVNWITIQYYNAAGGGIGSDNVLNQTATGGSSVTAGGTAMTSNKELSYFGAFPANLQNWSANFAAAVVNVTPLAYYTVQAKNPALSQLYTVKILCPNLKGYEAIRLTWLNQWGTWDYYTFNMKSTKSVSTNRTSYTQLGGTWNESTFKISDYKGGKKNFRVNSTEKITLNTDFVTEAEGVWFEQLVNSTEVYVLEGYQTDPSISALNTYAQPTTITNSSYTRKTIANDRLMQYTFEIEKSKMKRTQAV